MEIRSEPYSLQLKEGVCPCCASFLKKEVRIAPYLINGECAYCKYRDRPFGYNQKGNCGCRYGEKEFLFLTCENCKSPQCIQCNGPYQCVGKCANLLCPTCSEKKKFNTVWKTSTPQEKLQLYGIEKLKMLAKNKKIKGYSKYKKQELIHSLSEIVQENDFPIK